MKLELQNVGKIDHASINIEGITVVAGPNNSGKSSISKALYSVFNSLYKYDEYAQSLLIENIKSTLKIKSNEKELDQKVRDLVLNKSHYVASKNELRAILNDVLFYNKKKLDLFNDKPLEDQQVESIIESLSISEDEWTKYFFNRKIENEFSNQICNFYAKNDAKITLYVKGNPISIVIKKNEVSNIENAFPFWNSAIYIDNPFILDEIPTAFEFNHHASAASNHRLDLEAKLVFALMNGGGNQENGVNRIKNKRKLENVFSKLDFCGGSLRKSSDSQIDFFMSEANTPLNLKNLSAGLKAFVIIKSLLENNILESNGTLILDEPEIHLHPEWQILFAEIIVLLHKEFGLHILLTTHSPYFLEAVETFSERYGCAEMCNYYLIQEDEKNKSVSTVLDVNGKTDCIYRLLASSFQKLEDLKYEN